MKTIGITEQAIENATVFGNALQVHVVLVGVEPDADGAVGVLVFGARLELTALQVARLVDELPLGVQHALHLAAAHVRHAELRRDRLVALQQEARVRRTQRHEEEHVVSSQACARTRHCIIHECTVYSTLVI